MHRPKLVATLALVAVAALLPLLPAEAGSPDATDRGRGRPYRALVRRSAHGIPHIKASDWGSLGYGYGYAFTQDNLCLLAEDVVRVHGEQSWWFGRTTARLTEDLFFAEIKDRGVVEALLARSPDQGGPSQDVRDLVEGFAAGFNRVLWDLGGAGGIGDPRCQGAPWVRPLTAVDLWRTYYRSALYASSFALLNGIVAAQPPASPSPSAATATPEGRATPEPAAPAERAEPDDTLPPGDLQTALPRQLDLGSNGIALGRDATARGTGMVLANPHFPWDGPQRFYEAHLTIPGRYDVIGASLSANPVIEMGHNQHVAWTHTVSTARRFTLSELTLAPGDPTAYVVDGQVRRMTSRDVAVRVRNADGSEGTVTKRFWRTHEGPLVVVAPLGWTSTTAFALHDVNAETTNTFDGYIAMGRSRSIDDLRAAMDEWQHLPWINTIAADSSGEAYYGDHSIVPNLTDVQREQCATALSQLALDLAGVFITDGSRSACGWGTDPDARSPGIFGPANLPQLQRSDYVTNSNDSYWLANPEEPLNGFDRIIGPERTPRSLRTRLGLRLVQDRLAGTDGGLGHRFTRDDLQRAMFDNRVLGAELVRDDLVEQCRATPSVVVGGRTVDLAEACDVLAAWDLRVDLGSRGAHLFRAFAGFGGIVLATPFDPEDPVATPHTLASDPAVLQALGRAVLRYRDVGIPLDAPLGDLQGETRGTERIPIHGGTGTEGAFNVISAPFAGAAGFPDVTSGASFVMVAELGPSGPRSRALLTYSQSTDPTSPHFADQTRLFSAKRWVDLPYAEGDVAKAADRGTWITAPRP